ncbi:endolytic transglycosylase MltG [Flavobacteriaceae bacterium S356]|uniref:Endolytic murein transglycosylase n=1 Tax=Asprobacillus argus TaxID=3076534 RepID=A0ABU3LH17_9FLAO|nr:endolytic transglycosylase MltG [Flavobacteriaceae bacterium S356]
MIKKIIIGASAILLIIAGIIGFNYYKTIFGESVTKNGAIFVRTGSTLEELTSSLTDFLPEAHDFDWVAEKKKFTKPKAGKYQLTKGMSLNDLVNLLRSGNQVPVSVSFNNQDTLEKLAGRIAQQIEADSTALVTAMLDPIFLEKNKLTKASALGMYIPNTYHFYWNTSAEGFRNKMKKEFVKFWTRERVAKAKKIGLKRDEVLTMASIVQKETAQVSERPTVAGLYMNRFNKGWPLQADPAIIYILKQQHGQDYVVKRVLYKDLEIKSPYNTYLNRGLPPTLIAMPDISSIDAVLNYEKHNYFYMCVNVDKIGFHAFASDLYEHGKNARKYQRWLDKQGIRR